eukprot:scaffold32452_cov31-Prasinocladus_malaysianus.AAC.2
MARILHGPQSQTSERILQNEQCVSAKKADEMSKQRAFTSHGCAKDGSQRETGSESGKGHPTVDLEGDILGLGVGEHGPGLGRALQDDIGDVAGLQGGHNQAEPQTPGSDVHVRQVGVLSTPTNRTMTPRPSKSSMALA